MPGVASAMVAYGGFVHGFAKGNDGFNMVQSVVVNDLVAVGIQSTCKKLIAWMMDLDWVGIDNTFCGVSTF